MRLPSVAMCAERGRGRDGSHVVQPCAAHCDSQCAIYDARPQRCREFECVQLQRVAAGAITEAQAREKIAGAVRLVAEVEALLLRAGADNPRRALTQRCATALAEPHDPATAQTRSLLAQAKAKLDALLAEDFRTAPVS